MESLTTSLTHVRAILENLPMDWLELTTHRLDIYDESQAKSQFLDRLHTLLATSDFDVTSLQNLPTAYDYIRLGHQLSSILEWILGVTNQVSSDQVITFASKTMPILALLRRNTLKGTTTYLYSDGDIQPLIDCPRLENIYGFKFEVNHVKTVSEIPEHDQGSVVFVTQSPYGTKIGNTGHIDATVNLHPDYGSAIIVHGADFASTVKDVQHVRRRESIAMTPIHTLNLLHEIVGKNSTSAQTSTPEAVAGVLECIKLNTGSPVTPLVASSGLSIQYAMMMGLIEEAMAHHPNKAIKLIIPPNCYGGTNDQARRISTLISAVEIVDLYVDSGHDLVSSLDVALDDAAQSDSVPIILAEIPTNPRVEVPDMTRLAQVLTTQRKTNDKNDAVAPYFTVDQTFCPNVKLLDSQSELAKVKTISYSSGSKFPSGGRCIAGFCTTNEPARSVQSLIEKHLVLTDNAATAEQLNTLAENMPSMPARIVKAYENTRAFVDHIQTALPHAKINFISPALAERGFTPSVFSMDFPATGENAKEREDKKRELNSKLISFMITKHPDECKHCVSYGQLTKTYWTIPATSTQGTTNEKDKDYVVRVALSPETDVKGLSASFDLFCQNEGLL